MAYLLAMPFAYCWKDSDGDIMYWITQLVVHSGYRRGGPTTGLPNVLKEEGEAVYGTASWYPAAFLAAAIAFGRLGDYFEVVLMRYSVSTKSY